MEEITINNEVYTVSTLSSGHVIRELKMTNSQKALLTPHKRTLTKYEFRSLFTVQQKAAILNAAKEDPLIEVFNTDMMAADEINLDYQAVADGLDYLISQNLIPAELKNQIISGNYENLA
jgi:hypothetical protein